jgi:protein-tyrosine-phosphatase
VTAPVGDGVPDLTVLFVCTGNICRSPLAERLARAHLARALGPDTGSVRLVSAGTQAVPGRGMDPASARVLAELGGDPTGFGSRQLTGALVGSADLTLTMTRRHREEVLARAPRALATTYSLREAAGLLELVPAGPLPGELPLPGEQPRERVRALVRQLAGARARRSSGPDDDVRDPIGQPADVHEQVGEVIADALHPVLDRLVAVLAGRVGGPR